MHEMSVFILTQYGVMISCIIIYGCKSNDFYLIADLISNGNLDLALSDKLRVCLCNHLCFIYICEQFFKNSRLFYNDERYH